MAENNWINIDSLDALIIDNEFYDKQIENLNDQKTVMIENYTMNTHIIGQEYYEYLTQEKDLKILIINQIINLFNTLKKDE